MPPLTIPKEKAAGRRQVSTAATTRTPRFYHQQAPRVKGWGYAGGWVREIIEAKHAST